MATVMKCCWYTMGINRSNCFELFEERGCQLKQSRRRVWTAGATGINRGAVGASGPAMLIQPGIHIKGKERETQKPESPEETDQGKKG